MPPVRSDMPLGSIALARWVYVDHAIAAFVIFQRLAQNLEQALRCKRRQDDTVGQTNVKLLGRRAVPVFVGAKQ